MTNIGIKILFKKTNLILFLLIVQFSAGTGQVKEKSIPDIKVNEVNTQPKILNQRLIFRICQLACILFIVQNIQKDLW